MPRRTPNRRLLDSIGRVGPKHKAPEVQQQLKPDRPDRWRWGKVAFRCLELVALLFVIPTAIVLVIDLNDRKEQRIAQAWTLLTTIAPGNTGKGKAMEYLNSEVTCELCIDLPYVDIFKKQIRLNGIDVSENRHGDRVFLTEIDLSDAYLGGAKLQGAVLSLRI